MPAPEGGKALVAPVGVRDSAHVGRLTPSRSRLGSIPSLRARASRGTSLCYMFSFLLVQTCVLVLSTVLGISLFLKFVKAAPVGGREPRGGPLGPRGRDPP